MLHQTHLLYISKHSYIEQAYIDLRFMDYKA